MNKRVYLDNASTTPVDKEVLSQMLPYFSEKFGNSSSTHKLGQEATVAIDDARKTVSDFFSCNEDEVIFTGSATEANNLFIQGVVKGKENPHIITSAIEHDAVLDTVKNCGTDYTILSVDKDGFIRLEELKREIKEETVLVSIIYANNEIGTIQEIEEIGKLIKEINKNRKNKIIFHTDAVQAAGYLSVNVNKLGVDSLTISGHKIYGPKGVATLYIKKNKLKETTKLRDYVIEEVLKIKDSFLNGSSTKSLPNNANFSFRGVEGESVVMLLDQKGISTSTGSACSSKKLEPSHVLRAIGLDNIKAHSSLRVSIGRETTKEDIDYFLEKLREAIIRLREISGR